MAVRKCRDRVNGEICDYFVYGKNETPAWYNQDRPVHDGTYVIKDNSGNIHYFKLDISLIEKFEFIDEQPFADDESVGYIVPPSSGKRCIHRGTGIECDYFVWDIDAVPGWCDIVGGVGDYVVCDPEGMILCYSYENFNNNYKELDFELVEGWERCVRYMDGRVFSYCVDGSSFIDRIIVRIGKGHDMVIDRNFFYMCFSVRGNFGEPIKEGVDYSVGVFGKDDGSVLGSSNEEVLVESPRYCVNKKDPSTVYTYFIYGKDKTPDWYKRLKKETSQKVLSDFNLSEVEKCNPYIVAEGNSFEEIWFCPEGEGFDTKYSNCDVNGVLDEPSEYVSGSDGEVAVLDEDVAAGTKVHTDNWQKGLDEYVEKEEAKSSVNEGRICWRKSDTFIFNFFVYGVDNYPSWYNDENTFHQYLKEGDWVVRDFSRNRYDFYFYSCPNMVAGVFEEIEDVEFYDNSVIVDRDQYNEIKEQMELRKMLPDANQWFKKLAPEVFRYLVIRDMNRNDGTVDMLKLYKSETK